ncbi:hypothetical protein [Pseudomonas viridiflava]|uniref:hypothetical protein n=1 Tax=Pseudomonas viridiflava TaxID=33069 RepID=UPI000F02F051|nr:hypothetical protein [Pseudomonas viridiflava]
MNEIIVCPTFLIAKALSRLNTFYWFWDHYRHSPIPNQRRHAIAAKAHGLIWYDRTFTRSEVSPI